MRWWSLSCNLMTMLFVLHVGQFTAFGASRRGLAPVGGGEGRACASILDGMGETSLRGHVYDFGLEVHPLSSLVMAGEANLAVRYPDIVCSAAQRLSRVVLHDFDGDGKPFRVARDPNFRVARVNVWDIAQGINGTGRRIIGQYGAFDRVAKGIIGVGRGQKSGLMKELEGTSGTGKTEMLYVLMMTQAHLAATDPNFYQFGLRWKNLSRVPSLRSAIIIDKESKEERLLNEGLRNPDLTALFPAPIRSKILEIAGPRLYREIQVLPDPPGELDPINQYYLSQVLDFEAKRRGLGSPDELSPTQYVEALNDYVEIVRYIPRFDQNVLTFPGDENVDFGNLFFSENMVLRLAYANTPLAWNYGRIIRAYGGGLFIDERPRWPQQFQDLLLNLIQNRVVSYGGSPPMGLDLVLLTSGNTESVEKNKKTSTTGARAAVDRTEKIPVNLNIHPMEIAKVAAEQSGPRNYFMRSLTEGGADWVPADFQKIFPPPDEEGNLLGPDGRFALMYAPQGRNGPGAVVIAPRSLLLLGILASATRLETDRKALDEQKNHISLASLNQHLVVDVEKRVRLLLGLDKVSSAVAADLERFSKRTNEGSFGISSRDTDRLWKRALEMALEQYPQTPTLTPAILLAAFSNLDDTGTLRPTDNKSTMVGWQLAAQKMRLEILLPLLEEDLRHLESGSLERVNRIYGEVVEEISYMMDEDTDAESSEGDSRPIDRDRWAKIQQIFKQQTKEDLVPQKAGLRHAQAPVLTDGSKRWGPLYQAIQEYVIQTERSLLPRSSLVTYFNDRLAGKPTSGLDPSNLTRMKDGAENMNGIGYNTAAIRDALVLTGQLVSERKKLRD